MQTRMDVHYRDYFYDLEFPSRFLAFQWEGSRSLDMDMVIYHSRREIVFLLR